MKSLDEIKSIASTYSGGPIVLTALRDAIKWADAYRGVAITQEAEEIVDAEAQRILEEDAADAKLGMERLASFDPAKALTTEQMLKALEEKKGAE